MRLTRLTAKYALLAPLTLVALPQAAEARLEAKMYAITIWNAGCGGSQRDSWDDMVDAWYDEITDTGISILGWCVTGHCGDAFSRDGSTVNGNTVTACSRMPASWPSATTALILTRAMP